MATKYFIDADGKYIGGFDGAEPPDGAIEVDEPPEHAEDNRVGGKWVKSAARAAIESRKSEVKSDAFVQAFKDMTPAQVLTHVGKISNLAEAKELLAKFGIILLVVAKDQLD